MRLGRCLVDAFLQRLLTNEMEAKICQVDMTVQWRCSVLFWLTQLELSVVVALGWWCHAVLRSEASIPICMCSIVRLLLLQGFDPAVFLIGGRGYGTCCDRMLSRCRPEEEIACTVQAVGQDSVPCLPPT